MLIANVDDLLHAVVVRLDMPRLDIEVPVQVEHTNFSLNVLLEQTAELRAADLVPSPLSLISGAAVPSLDSTFVSIMDLDSDLRWQRNYMCSLMRAKC